MDFLAFIIDAIVLVFYSIIIFFNGSCMKDYNKMTIQESYDIILHKGNDKRGNLCVSEKIMEENTDGEKNIR